MESLIEEGNEVLFINANDNIRDQDYKTWEDVLDVIVRSRFKDGVTFLNMDVLRRNRGMMTVLVYGSDFIMLSKAPKMHKIVKLIYSFPDQNISTLELINEYISNNGKDKMVRYLYNECKHCLFTI